MAVLSIAIMKMYKEVGNTLKKNSEKKKKVENSPFLKALKTCGLGFFYINFINLDVWQQVVKACYIDPSFQFNSIG